MLHDDLFFSKDCGFGFWIPEKSHSILQKGLNQETEQKDRKKKQSVLSYTHYFQSCLQI